METEVRKIREGITIIHGDCMEAMKGYGENEFDLAVVDPPYGIGEDGRKTKGRDVLRFDPRNGAKINVPARNYKLGNWDNNTPEPEYFEQIRRVSENQIIWGGNYFTDNLQPSSAWIVWDKVNGDCDFADCELAWTSFKRAVRQIEFMWAGFKQGRSVKEGRTNQGNKKLCEIRQHPTQKPVALYRWIYDNYAKPGMKVLDTHLGSGSNAIAAYYAGMDFTGIELDRDYFEAACKRIERETRQMQLYEPAPKRETGNQMSILEL